jgi:high-affinity nickel-transport protein
MLSTYGWAYVKPMRKLYYNMVVTLISVLVALIVGGIEAFGVFAQRLGLSGSPWNALAAVSNNFGVLGFVIVGVFAASWLVWVAVYRLRRYDRLDLEPASPAR